MASDYICERAFGPRNLSRPGFFPNFRPFKELPYDNYDILIPVVDEVYSLLMQELTSKKSAKENFGITAIEEQAVIGNIPSFRIIIEGEIFFITGKMANLVTYHEDPLWLVEKIRFGSRISNERLMNHLFFDFKAFLKKQKPSEMIKSAAKRINKHNLSYLKNRDDLMKYYQL
ncbi:MAG: hypothetical protein ABIG40_02690 [Parcubacteria group bacterium]